MWWIEITQLDRQLSLARGKCEIAPGAIIEDGAVLDPSHGPLRIAHGARICRGAILQGPGSVGHDTLIGTNAFLRGPFLIESCVRVGFATELKNAIVRSSASIGPMCFIADSLIEQDAYLGAMVRTSNQRLDRRPVSVIHNGEKFETGLDKLGCHIGSNAALGIQVIVLPGRVIQPDTVFEPRLTIDRNYPTGHYRAVQNIQPIQKELCQ
jgi:UDP-N-acetylglucosamine diphosphorylase / glucose-1-phosphate thymidylyltransferase / UDP-N-acetylgalactosamine diphosphorylase / glucosamine-1-phosphate N-acetyltransferase / galactosamine-1-phosphate N-acetyltransferase